MLIEEILNKIENLGQQYSGIEDFKEFKCENCSNFLSNLRTRLHPSCQEPNLYTEEQDYHPAFHNKDFLCKYFESKLK